MQYLTKKRALSSQSSLSSQNVYPQLPHPYSIIFLTIMYVDKILRTNHFLLQMFVFYDE
jgi:hypothetical protein